MPLTDAKVRNSISPKGTTKIADGEGLYLLVRSNGSKHWQFRYRFANKEKSVTFGKYPQVSLADARNKRLEAQRLLAGGKDPSAARKEEKLLAVFRDKNSFGSVAKEWLERNSGIWSERHLNRVTRRLENHLFPKLGRRPIHEILPIELLIVIQEVEKTGAVYSAKRCLQLCGAIFNHAIITGRVTHNITLGLSGALRPYRETNHPTISARELPEFLSALSCLRTTEQNKLAFHLLLFSALRTGELRRSRWVDIDFERREWVIPAENTKMRSEHLVPMSDQLATLLGELQKLSGSSEWLFPNQQRGAHEVMSENTINHMIHRMGYKGRIVGHGFRSLFSTVLNENGANRDAIERQLAHMERNKVRAAYNRAEYLDERRSLMQWWGDFLEERMPDPVILNPVSSPADARSFPSNFMMLHQN
ncbi:MAG: integrase arm-type DNA-binding domain-containing protein [Verrucomicrobiota bacterium]